jgi:hypothetical protein
VSWLTVQDGYLAGVAGGVLVVGFGDGRVVGDVVTAATVTVDVVTAEELDELAHPAASSRHVSASTVWGRVILQLLIDGPPHRHARAAAAFGGSASNSGRLGPQAAPVDLRSLS